MDRHEHGEAPPGPADRQFSDELAAGGTIGVTLAPNGDVTSMDIDGLPFDLCDGLAPPAIHMFFDPPVDDGDIFETIGTPQGPLGFITTVEPVRKQPRNWPPQDLIFLHTVSY